MPEKITLNPVQYIQGLIRLTDKISVRGEDVDSMKLLRDGLKVLQQALVQPQEAAQERKEGEHGTV